jgi:RNA polymerase sigma factor (sigma-70 family)
MQDIEQLYLRYGHLVLRRARRILADEQEAHEVLQEIFVSLMEQPDQFSGRSTISTWLYSVTTHACLGRLRNQRNRARLRRERVAPAAAGAEQPSSAEQLLVSDLLARLPVPLAQAAIHYYVDEMTHEEIAVLLGCSRRHVGDLLERFHTEAGALVRAS